MAKQSNCFANKEFTGHSPTSSRLEQGPYLGPDGTMKTQRFWAIRVRFELGENHHGFAMFNMAIDRKRRWFGLSEQVQSVS
jgi:hypothetical protein